MLLLAAEAVRPAFDGAFSSMPQEVVLYIMHLLPPETLVVMLKVNRAFNMAIKNDDHLSTDISQLKKATVTRKVAHQYSDVLGEPSFLTACRNQLPPPPSNGNIYLQQSHFVEMVSDLPDKKREEQCNKILSGLKYSV